MRARMRERMKNFFFFSSSSVISSLRSCNFILHEYIIGFGIDYETFMFMDVPLDAIITDYDSILFHVKIGQLKSGKYSIARNALDKLCVD